MKIEQLIIENFRQFKGRKKISFATQKLKNVTVIHAENGFGKTALLNALLWGFYGADGLTEDLPKKECLLHESLNRKSRRSSEDCARVIIEFTDGNDHYTLTRSISLSQQIDDARKSDLSLEVRLEDGGTITMDTPRQAQLKIDNLMPRGISQYLFFNGERIDHLAMEKSSGEITEAIHQMLGLQLLQRTIDDLNHGNVRGVLKGELRDNTDAETTALLDVIDDLEKEIADLKRKVEANKLSQTANRTEKAQIDSNLELNKAARDLQKERKRLEEEIVQMEAEALELARRLAKLISDNGFTMLAEPLASKGEEIADQLRKENKLPPKVHVGFVRDLLKEGICLCGCTLKPGTNSYSAVEKWFAVAGDESLSTAVGLLEKAIGAIKLGAPTTRTSLQATAKDRAALRHKINKHRERIEEISGKLGDKEDDGVHELETRREKLNQKYIELLTDARVFDRDLQHKSVELETKRREMLEKKQKEKIAEQARRRLKALDETIALLERILTNERDDLRAELGAEIRKNFDEVKLKPDHWLELTPGFTLKLLKRTGANDETDQVDVAHSTGERQLMSLVFMASLVALARRRSEAPVIIQGLSGSEFPLVMDSPFGQLGEDLRSGVAEWVPTLAPQVVLLLTSSQYKGEVESQLTAGKRVGRRYLLTYHAPTKPAKAKKSVELNGERYSQYFQSDVEFTEIQEIDK